MAANYRRDHRLISRYDTVTLVVQIAMVFFLFATRADAYSFLTGLFVGMSLIQVYFHRFIQPLPPDKVPESPFLPVKLVSYAIQSQAGAGVARIFADLHRCGLGTLCRDCRRMVGPPTRLPMRLRDFGL